MSVLEFFRSCLDQSYDAVMRSVEDLTAAELSWRPAPGAMPIGFILWHYSRVLDMWPARLDGTPQLWEQGWAEKLGRASDPRENGFGFTPEQVDAFQVPSEPLLLEYAEAAYSKLRERLETLGDGSLDELGVTTRTGAVITLTTLFQQLVWELNQHGGQMAYLRGVQRGIEDRHYPGPALETALRGQ